jgi:hypothetical protein
VRTNHVAGRQRQLGLFLALAVLLASCVGGVTSDSMDRDVPRPDGPSYDLTVKIPGRASQRFTGTVTTWDPLTGIITLGPEERGEPLGLFVLTLVSTESGNVLSEATFSTTKVRVGTAADLQAELYGAQAPDCGNGVEGFAPFNDAVTVTRDWVSGRVCFVVAGLEPEDVPPSAVIGGTIAAFAP